MKNFWWNWLFVVTIGVMLFGLSMVFMPAAIQVVFNFVAFQNTGVETLFGAEAVHYIQFVYGVLGAVMFGWTIPLLFILFGDFRAGKKAGWLALALSIGGWFIVDSSWSAYMGFWGNVVLNLGFLVLYLVPLVATAPRFWRGTFASPAA